MGGKLVASVAIYIAPELSFGAGGGAMTSVCRPCQSLRAAAGLRRLGQQAGLGALAPLAETWSR
jgi:hypothetical protein